MKSKEFFQSALDLVNGDDEPALIKSNLTKASLNIPPITSLAGMKFFPETYNYCVDLLLLLYADGQYQPDLHHGKWIIYCDSKVSNTLVQDLSIQEDLGRLTFKRQDRSIVFEFKASNFFLPERVKSDLDRIQNLVQNKSHSNISIRCPAIYTPLIYYKLPKNIRDQLNNYIYKTNITLSI